MVKELKKQILAKASELGWDNVSADPEVIALQNRNSVTKYTVSAPEDAFYLTLRATLRDFQEDRFVGDWYAAPHTSEGHEFVTIADVRNDAGNIRYELHALLQSIEQTA